MKAQFVFAGADDRRARSIAALLLSILVLQTSAGFISTVQASQSAPKKSGKLSDDQRIAHVLSRLTFGARPGDFERVKAMGVEAFINQQLDPDAIDNSAVIARLRRLPTLGMATPVIIEQYTPPKPVASPSPTPAKSPDPKVVLAAPPLEVLPDRAMRNDTMSASSEMVKPSDAMQKPADGMQQIASQSAPSPKPTPPPKNPQMVVTELQRAKLLRAVYGERQL